MKHDDSFYDALTPEQKRRTLQLESETYNSSLRSFVDSGYWTVEQALSMAAQYVDRWLISQMVTEERV